MYPVLIVSNGSGTQRIDDPTRNTTPRGFRCIPRPSGSQTMAQAIANLQVAYQFQGLTSSQPFAAELHKNPPVGLQVLDVVDDSTVNFGGAGSSLILSRGVPGQQYLFIILELQNENIEPGTLLNTATEFPPETEITTPETGISMAVYAAPTASDGADILTALSVEVSITSDDGTASFVPQGSLQAWVREAGPTWIRSPQLDYDLTFIEPGQTTIQLPIPVRVLVPYDRIAFRPFNMQFSPIDHTLTLSYLVIHQDQGITFDTGSETGFSPTDAVTTQPPIDDTDGVSTSNTSAIRVIIHPDAGGVSPGGGLRAFLFDGSSWTRAPGLDLTVDTNFDTASDAMFADLPITGNNGDRVAWRPENMTLNGGGTTVGLLYRLSIPSTTAGAPTVNVSPSLVTVWDQDGIAVPTATAVELKTTGANSARRNILVENNGPNKIYVGKSSVAATLKAKGTPIAPDGDQVFEGWLASQKIYAVADTADQVSPFDTRITEFN